jgi:hypothetical protein
MRRIRFSPLQSIETRDVTGDRTLVTLVVQFQFSAAAKEEISLADRCDLGAPEPDPGEPRLPPAVFRLKEKTGNYIAAIELVYGVTRGRGKAYKQAKQECDEWLAKQGEQDA